MSHPKSILAGIALKLFKDYTVAQFCTYLDDLNSYPEDSLNELINDSRYLLKLVEDNKKMMVLKTVSKFTIAQRIDLKKYLSPIIKDFTHPEKIFNIVKAISDFDVHQRIILLEKIPLIKDKSKILEVLKFLIFMPPNILEEVLTIFISRPHLLNSPRSVFFTLYEDIRLNVHEFLLRQMDVLIMDKEAVEAISKFVIDQMDSLLLHQEHPLLQKAIQIRSITSHSDSDNKRNPYVLFQYLKDLTEKEAIIPFKPQSMRINGVEASLNIDKIRGEGSVQKVFIFGDPDPTVPMDGFELLFSQLEERLLALSETDRTHAHKYISDCFVENLDKIKEYFMMKSLVKSLGYVKGNATDPIDSALYYLHTILRVLWKADNKVGKNPLSPREELLLRISTSVNACPTGQRDGIVNYFNNLSFGHRNKLELGNSEERAVQLIKLSVQKILHSILSDREFHKILLKVDVISEMPHQILFVKNRFHLQIGYEHRLTFDASSGVIKEKLFNMTVSEFLEVFFKFCTPAKVLNQLKRDAMEALECKYVGYMDLVNLMELKGKKIQHDQFSVFIMFDVDDKPLGLTDEGALRLLKSSDYFV